MNVLVTGASGFIGGALLDELVKLENIRIFAIFHKNLPRYKDTYCNKVEWIRCNLVEDEFQFSGKQIDLVYHLAAVSPDGVNNKQINYKLHNEDVTLRLARSAKSHNISRFMYVSSIAACEYSRQRVVDENNGVPKSRYGESKKNAEDLLLKLHDQNFLVTIIRPVGILGPYHKGSLFELAKTLKKKKFFFIGSTNKKLNFIFLQDFIFDLVSLTWCSNAYGEIFISSDDSMTTKDLVDIIMSELSCKYSIIRIPTFFGIIIGVVADMISSSLRINLPISTRRVLAMTRNIEYSSAKINKFIPGRCNIGIKNGIVLILKSYVAEKWV